MNKNVKVFWSDCEIIGLVGLDSKVKRMCKGSKKMWRRWNTAKLNAKEIKEDAKTHRDIGQNNKMYFSRSYTLLANMRSSQTPNGRVCIFKYTIYTHIVTELIVLQHQTFLSTMKFVDFTVKCTLQSHILQLWRKKAFQKAWIAVKFICNL